jgi:hypothetical protein
LENAARFPHSHSAGDSSFFPLKTTPKGPHTEALTTDPSGSSFDEKMLRYDRHTWENYCRASRGNMRITLSVLGALLVLFGGVWFLQGINVLPGSFMTGQIRWAVYGGIAVVAGIAVLVAANRRRV